MGGTMGACVVSVGSIRIRSSEDTPVNGDSHVTDMIIFFNQCHNTSVEGLINHACENLRKCKVWRQAVLENGWFTDWLCNKRHAFEAAHLNGEEEEVYAFWPSLRPGAIPFEENFPSVADMRTLHSLYNHR